MSCDPMHDLRAAHTALKEAPAWEAAAMARIFAARVVEAVADQEKRLRALEEAACQSAK